MISNIQWKNNESFGRASITNHSMALNCRENVRKEYALDANAYDIVPSRYRARMLLIVGQYHNIIVTVAESL